MAEFKIPIVIDGIEIIEKMKAEGRFVPVTRCGECKHRGFHRAFNCRGDIMTDFPENSRCPMRAGLLIMPDDFFCKYGEPKEDEK